MNTPGLARDALARNADRAAGERAEQDPELGAMRTVWRAMRDEEPSDRGLADLLAAARAKAETMQVQPTLWQRLVAGLRHPPALALATVVVLVGGAVILGRRGVEVSAPARSPGAADHAQVVPRQLARPAVAEEESLAPVAGRAAAGTEDGSLAPVAGVVSTSPSDGSPPGAGMAKLDTAGRSRAPAPAGAAVPPRPSTSQADLRGARPSRADRDRVSDVDDRTGAIRPPRSEPPAPPPPEVDESAKTRERTIALASQHDPASATPVPLAQLYQQCESAARRGDCVAVRLMVGRIAKTDRSYRARVAKDSPVAKCLAE
ncbi:MAG TPA: hypothetical protein VHN14_13755 [Kofleriaceae bacterium]|nr:hypothetical protein [Kofleriaceae bacterium]